MFFRVYYLAAHFQQIVIFHVDWPLEGNVCHVVVLLHKAVAQFNLHLRHCKHSIHLLRADEKPDCVIGAECVNQIGNN